MAIENYNDLQTEIADWSHRTDLATKIPTFIALAEKRIANKLHTRKQETSVIIPTVAGVQSIDLPNDYASLKNITVLSDYQIPLNYIPDHTFLRYNTAPEQGIPEFYTIQANQILLTPTPNEVFDIQLVYVADLTPLSSVNPVNWVLTKYPILYIYGALIEAGVFTNDPELIQFYTAAFNTALDDIYSNNMLESFSGSPLQSTSDYVV